MRAFLHTTPIANGIRIVSEVGVAAITPPVASIIRKSDTTRLSEERDTLRAAFPIPCRSKNLPCTVSSFVNRAPTMAKITMPTSSSMSVKPRRALRILECLMGHPWGQSVQRTFDVRAFVRVKFTVSGLYIGFAGVMTILTFFTTLETGSLTVIVRVCGYG